MARAKAASLLLREAAGDEMAIRSPPLLMMRAWCPIEPGPLRTSPLGAPGGGGETHLKVTVGLVQGVGEIEEAAFEVGGHTPDLVDQAGRGGDVPDPALAVGVGAVDAAGYLAGVENAVYS